MDLAGKMIRLEVGAKVTDLLGPRRCRLGGGCCWWQLSIVSSEEEASDTV